MAAPALVTVIYDALVEQYGGSRPPASLARGLAALLENKVVVIDPDELHTININEDGTWTLGHPVACKPELFGCVFHALALAGFEAPHPGRFNLVIDEIDGKPSLKVIR